jgi:U5 small nuclear ribonucleoprotein component
LILNVHALLLLLLQVCSKVFGSATGIVDMLVQHVPSSKDATAAKVARLYTGPQDPNSPLIQFMTGCSRTGEHPAPHV